jgi:uridine kinase
MFIIGITGLSCSGKTQLSQNLQKYLGENECLMISLDDYYKELTDEQHKILYEDEANINFDVPDAIDFKKLIDHINLIKTNQPCSLPKFDLGSCVLDPSKCFLVEPNKYKFIIIEGVFVFCCEALNSLFNLKIWVETSEYVCALRRFIKYTRDIKGYSSEYIYNQCIKFVIPGKIILFLYILIKINFF